MIREVARSAIGRLLETHPRLLEGAPTPVLTATARILADAKPLSIYPGWRFAIEERTPTSELSGRLALWTIFRERDITAPVRVKWDGKLRLDLVLGNDQSRC